MLKKVSKCQKGFEPTTYRTAGKHSTDTAVAGNDIIDPLLTYFSYLAAAGRLVVGIDGRLPARYTLPIIFCSKQVNYFLALFFRHPTRVTEPIT